MITADDLRAVRDLIEERGLARKHFVERNGSCCVAGAFLLRRGYTRDQNLGAFIADYQGQMKEFARAMGFDHLPELYSWSDTTSLAEILRVLNDRINVLSRQH